MFLNLDTAFALHHQILLVYINGQGNPCLVFMDEWHAPALTIGYNK